MNPQPAPTVSGKYISGESPATWVQEMPLTDGGISSKAAGESFKPRIPLQAGETRVPPRAPPIPDQPSICRKRRRVTAFHHSLRVFDIYLTSTRHRPGNCIVAILAPRAQKLIAVQIALSLLTEWNDDKSSRCGDLVCMGIQRFSLSLNTLLRLGGPRMRIRILASGNARC